MFGMKALSLTAAALAAGVFVIPGTANAQPDSPGTGSTRGINDCPSGWMCFWTGANFGGRMMKFHDEGRWQNLPAQAFSFYNNRGHDAATAPGSGGTGGKTCVDGHFRNSYAHSGVKSVYLAHTGKNC